MMKNLMIAGALTAAFLLCLANVRAEAMDCTHDNNGRVSCSDTTTLHARRYVERHVDANGGDAQIIGGRPAGCPFRYCGCALAKFLGISDKRLNLAWAWAKLFPRRSQPAPATPLCDMGMSCCWFHKSPAVNGSSGITIQDAACLAFMSEAFAGLFSSILRNATHEAAQ